MTANSLALKEAWYGLDPKGDTAHSDIITHKQRVEFPALDTTGPIGSTSPGIPTCFRTLSTSEDGAWHGDLNVRRWEDDGAGREASLRGSKVDGGRDSDGQLTRPNQYPGPLS
ncbi:Hypothetical protein SMAX5B_018660 [Scophthalmus maximus]|uniref:Uncharacterized protein n=1 Tax=Scophthalmus maximus TaxID=52904 RepID=A0A2U9CDK3_SCOMX|nr:Hypothetical protein SMAX5B_018660 [Scophthalmus maximus]